MPVPARAVDVPAGWLLLTAWYVTSMRAMPGMMLRARRLQAALRGEPGCLHVHRWISRRGVLVLTRWESREAAWAWLASPAYRRFDDAAMRIPGTATVVEIRGPASGPEA